jgi:hypothetical protein
VREPNKKSDVSGYFLKEKTASISEPERLLCGSELPAFQISPFYPVNDFEELTVA